MTQTIYTDRSRIQAKQRCPRLRWLEYHEGEAGVGLTPKRKSIHLVVGGAVHAGMEVLLGEGQESVDLVAGETLAEKLDNIFVVTGNMGDTIARRIEDRAVAAALIHLSSEMGSEGVELDPEEQAARQASQQETSQLAQPASPQIDMGGLVPGQSSNSAGPQDSPIVIEFGDLANFNEAAVIPKLDAVIDQVNQKFDAHQSNDDYLKEEIAALVEGMVRCWARRRWRGLLAEFEVLEVEREGEWQLSEWDEPHDLVCHSSACRIDHHRALHFLSRHDALLLERSTGYLYLQSFKTTGSWDRRKELDAQVDMQGLSEAVDVERRLGEAWQLIHKVEDAEEFRITKKRIDELVSPRVAEWLAGLPDPPTILGIRYEYLLKGSRKKDKKDPFQPDRYVQESILCRAWKQEGITSDDRRWAWTYEWNDETGKTRRLDYRSWQKVPVWKSMTVAEWIDLLDAGKVQEGALREDAELMDALAAQFVPVLIQYRNRDETLDLLEQLESQEVQVARDVAEVKQAEQREGYAGKRTALNRLFPQNRQNCSYPGVCQYRTTPSQAGFCFGAPDPFHDPVVLDRFVQRVPNHPKENSFLVTISLDKQRAKD